MKVNVKAVAKYNGHSIGNNGNVNMKLKFGYDELTNYIQLIQMLNNDVKIEIKHPDQKKFSLGMFRIKTINIGDDGEGTVTFNSTNDFVEMDNLNKLIMQNKDEQFQSFFAADIELENEDEDMEDEQESEEEDSGDWDDEWDDE